MTSNTPIDAAGNPLTSIGEGPLYRSNKHPDSVLRKLIDRRCAVQVRALGEGVRDALYERDARIAALEKQVVDLQWTLDVQRSIAHLTARIDGSKTRAAPSSPTRGRRTGFTTMADQPVPPQCVM